MESALTGISYEDIMVPEYSHHWEGLDKRPQESHRRPGLGRYSHSRIRAAADEMASRTG